MLRKSPFYLSTKKRLFSSSSLQPGIPHFEFPFSTVWSSEKFKTEFNAFIENIAEKISDKKMSGDGLYVLPSPTILTKYFYITIDMKTPSSRGIGKKYEHKIVTLLGLNNSGYMVAFRNNISVWFGLKMKKGDDMFVETKPIFDLHKMESSNIPASYSLMKPTSFFGVEPFERAVRNLSKFGTEGERTWDSGAVSAICKMLFESIRFKPVECFVYTENRWESRHISTFRMFYFNNFLNEGQRKNMREEDWYDFDQLIHRWSKISRFYLCKEKSDFDPRLVPLCAMRVLKYHGPEARSKKKKRKKTDNGEESTVEGNSGAHISKGQLWKGTQELTFQKSTYFGYGIRQFGQPSFGQPQPNSTAVPHFMPMS